MHQIAFRVALVALEQHLFLSFHRLRGGHPHQSHTTTPPIASARCVVSAVKKCELVLLLGVT